MVDASPKHHRSINAAACSGDQHAARARSRRGISRPTRLGSAGPRDSDQPTHATRIGRPTRLGSAEPNEAAVADGNFETRGARCIAPGQGCSLHGAWASVCTATQTKQSDHAWRMGVRLHCNPNETEWSRMAHGRPSALHPKRNRVITHGAWAYVCTQCTAPQTRNRVITLGVRLHCTQATVHPKP